MAFSGSTGALIISHESASSENNEPYPILHASNQVVLYNPRNHALTIRPSESTVARRQPHTPLLCPYCSRSLSDVDSDSGDSYADTTLESGYTHESTAQSRAANYFQLLEVANETSSRPASPPLPQLNDSPSAGASASYSSPTSSTFRKEAMAEGYFKAFFVEEARLGMGANGSVYLCQHMLDGNPLGRFAVKKVAVGESSSYLLQILREVRLLESLQHPNIITYHHAWLENTQFSHFSPPVPTLHILMQWAEGGSLDDYIEARLGRGSLKVPPGTSTQDDEAVLDSPVQTRSGRIRAFRAMQRASPSVKERLRSRLGLGDNSQAGGTPWKAVHLFSAEEVSGLFSGIVDGLAFLHDKSILHLDLKPGNVLLTWDEGNLIPRAMLSDFGTSRDMINSSGTRTGNTGTLEYAAPESLPLPPLYRLPPIDSKADMWSLGMILHKLLFFRLPYRWASDGEDKKSADIPLSEGTVMDRLEQEVRSYQGFKANEALQTAFKSRRIPHAYIVLLENLLHITPSVRSSCDRIQSAMRKGQLNPLPRPSGNKPAAQSLVPATRVRAHSPENTRTESNTIPPSITQFAEIYTVPGTEKQDSLSEQGNRLPTPLSAPLGPQNSATEKKPWWMHLRVIRTIKTAVFLAKIVSLYETDLSGCSWIPLAALTALAVHDNISDDFRITITHSTIHLAALAAYRIRPELFMLHWT